MSNTIKLFTGKIKKDGNFAEMDYIIPKNVIDANYFQVACQYHALDLICTEYQNKLTKFAFDYDVDIDADIDLDEDNNIVCDSIEDEDLLEELLDIISYKNRFEESLKTLSDNINDNSQELYVCIACDTFAQYFVSSHLKITSRKEVEYSDNSEKLVNVPLDIWTKWSDAVMDAKVLVEWVDNGKKAHEKQNTFDLFRSTLNKLLSKQNDFYNKKDFSKMGENLIINHFLTSCKKDITTGKNGGFKQDYKNCQVLLQNLIKTGFIYLGCSEVVKVEKKNSACITYEALEKISIENENVE